jgi:hypothetical protein
MTETATPYQEQLVCRYAETDEFGDYDHGTHDGDCDWIRRCNVCNADVSEAACPDHAPLNVPGLRLIGCDATPPHSRTWVLDDDCYEPPCPWCLADQAMEAHEGCEHAGHGRWRRWGITKRLASKLYALGVVSGTGTAWGGGCKGCLTHLSWGRSSYVLGWPRWKWQCVLVARHWPGTEIDGCWGLCGKCSPCPGCKTVTNEHRGCPYYTQAEAAA